MHIDASESARSQDKVLKFPAMRVCGRFGRPRILLASACLFAAPRGELRHLNRRYRPGYRSLVVMRGAACTAVTCG